MSLKITPDQGGKKNHLKITPPWWQKKKSLEMTPHWWQKNNHLGLFSLVLINFRNLPFCFL
jgi:hypothetical protein